MTRSDTRGQPLALLYILALASINSSIPRDLGASLPLLLKVVPPTTSTTVQDNTVPLSLLDVRPHRLEPG